MVDIASIQAAIGSLQAAGNIAKAAIGLRDAAMIQERVIELNTVILAAQSSALDAKMEQAALIEQVGQLEKEVTRLKEWDTDKKRYRLHPIAFNSVAYLLKRAEANGEPAHALCANCYERGEKAHLQNNGNPFNDKNALVCHRCKSEIKTGGMKEMEYAD